MEKLILPAIPYAFESKHASAEELYGKDPWLRGDDRKVAQALLDSFESARSILGRPLTISSGRRSEKKQAWLIEQGYKASKRSTHIYGLALDILTPRKMGDEFFARVLRDAAMECCGGVLPRIGYKEYRNGREAALWVHLDIAPYASKMDPKAAEDWPPEWKKLGVIW